MTKAVIEQYEVRRCLKCDKDYPIPAYEHKRLLCRHCAEKQARELLEQARNAIYEFIKDTGGCDHPTGICACPEINLVEKIDRWLGRP